MTIYSVLCFLSLNVQSACDTLTVDCGPTYASTYVPSEGRLVTSEENSIGGKFIFVAFYWNSSGNMSALKADPRAWNFPSLEPDIEYPSNEAAYITNITDQEALAIPTILSYRKLPCPYIDTSIDDESPRPTIGSACPEYFEANKWYYSLATGTGNSSSSKIALRFQLGSWMNVDSVCLSTQGFPFFDPVPLYPEAPYCVFSCCHKGTGSNENNIYTIEMNEGNAPGCIDWEWPSDFSPSACPENCSNGVDDNWDGLTDCDDPDCVNAPNCSGLIDPPIDPCASVSSGNGYYCGRNEELTNYPGNDDDIVYCFNSITVSVEYCENGCHTNLPGYDDECLDPGCNVVCSTGQTRCNGNNVEICAANQCEYEYWNSCGNDENCINGSCVNQTLPAPTISSVSCTSYMRGTSNVTCTIFGSNFDCLPGSNTFIGDFYNSPAESCSPTQLVVSGNWDCETYLGFKQVSHRNADNQRYDTFNLLELIMGELEITEAWQQTVHEGATDVPMGANGCNFGNGVVFWAGGIQITNTHLQAQNQVLATGTVVGSIADSPVDVCIAKYPGASIGFDKKCWYDFTTIIP